MKKLIVVIGLPGCGKDTVGEFLKEKGIPAFDVAGVVRREMRKVNLPITKENQERFAKDMRMKHGMDIFGRLLGKELEREPSEIICITGPRTLDELIHWEKLGKIVTLEIVADEKIRFERCHKRGNKWDPKTIADLRMRDRSNLEQLGLAKLLKTEKYPRYVINNNGSKAALKEKVLVFLRKIKE